MQAIAIVTKKPFSKIKVYFDSAMVIVSLITCIIMTHTLGSVGLGTIISAITKRKPTIIFPRLKKYNEHVDDHQLEIAEAFSRRNYAKVCKENTDLKKLIDECRVCKFSNYESKREDIINEILRFISLDS